ncbi:MAG: zinc ribbon domain-containing protein [Leptospiraceae bacterium]|nr:zinc ribbon domain-containing protein [Leptospiraceae bacterium]
MKNCSKCNQPNTNKAKVCNNCGNTSFGNIDKNTSSGSGSGCLYLLFFMPIELYLSAFRKFPKITVGITILMIISSFLAPYNHNKQVETEKAAISSDSSFPKEELAFITLFNSAKDQMLLADDKAKKELIKKNLKIDSIKVLPRNFQISNWKGEVTKIEKSPYGETIGFKIRLSGSNVYFTNYGSSVSHLDSYGIKKENKLFNEIASLSARTDVIFSGKLINKQKEFEKTIDEKIEEPNFIFELTEITTK